MSSDLICVDGSNVAWEAPTSDRRPRVGNIMAVSRLLEALGFSPLVIVDASLKHHADDPEQLEALFNAGRILQAPSGTVADWFLLRTAQQHDAQVVSNDEFEQYRAEFDWIKRRRVPFMIVGDTVELYFPKLAPPARRASRARRGRHRAPSPPPRREDAPPLDAAEAATS